MLHREGVNGVLVDEMGLGKSVQTLALRDWIRAAENSASPHLIVTPASTLIYIDRNRHSFVTAAIPQRILLDSGTHSGLTQSTAVPLNSNKSINSRTFDG